MINSFQKFDKNFKNEDQSIIIEEKSLNSSKRNFFQKIEQEFSINSNFKNKIDEENQETPKLDLNQSNKNFFGKEIGSECFLSPPSNSQNKRIPMAPVIPHNPKFDDEIMKKLEMIGSLNLESEDIHQNWKSKNLNKIFKSRNHLFEELVLLIKIFNRQESIENSVSRNPENFKKDLTDFIRNIKINKNGSINNIKYKPLSFLSDEENDQNILNTRNLMMDKSLRNLKLNPKLKASTDTKDSPNQPQNISSINSQIKSQFKFN